MSKIQPNQIVWIVRWLARVAAVSLLVFWGTFFVAHLQQWFFRADGLFPPAWVWGSQLLHLLMLVGLGLTLRWERIGAAVVIGATAAFFLSIGYSGFPFLALINLVPLALLAVCWSLEAAYRKAPPTPV